MGIVPTGPPFGSLDFVYLPTADVEAAVDRYVDGLGAELVWFVRGMGTTVAAVRVSADGPLLLLSGHLEGDVPILVYRVEDYAATVASLRAGGIGELDELEIPHGPVAAFRMPDGQRLAVYELTRPGAVTHFDGRDDR
jgi:catechol 2,3-dioxygenase-like lactoylglutathione lyase family enzyme